MTLKNLLGISLDAVPADKGMVTKLLAAAQRNLADAQLDRLSAENRFDVAYKAIMRRRVPGQRTRPARARARMAARQQARSSVMAAR